MNTSMQNEIRRLIELRAIADIDCRSPVRILVAEQWRYAAEIGDLCMKIGPGDWCVVLLLLMFLMQFSIGIFEKKSRY